MDFTESFLRPPSISLDQLQEPKALHSNILPGFASSAHLHTANNRSALQTDSQQIEHLFSQFLQKTHSPLSDDPLRLVAQPHLHRAIRQSKAQPNGNTDPLIGSHRNSPLVGGSARSAKSAKLADTESVFNLKANLADQDQFYDLPYPSNLRLNAKGQPDLTGFPIWDDSSIVQDLKSIASDRPGFPVNSVGYFRFNAALEKQTANHLIPAQLDSPVLLLDVDPRSPDRGRLYPTVAATPKPDTHYVPNALLEVAPFPGIVLHPDRQYAYVVQRSLKDAKGNLLGVPKALEQLVNGKTPAGALGGKVRQLYQPLWDTLDQVGLDRKTVAAATVFTTGDVVAETAKLSQQILDRYDLTLNKLALDPTDGATHPRYWELHGTIRFPQFQQGQPPFNTKGRFQFDKNGSLVEQRTEVAPVTLTIPKTPMPVGGYPLAVYVHGANGLSTQGVDRGAITKKGGEPTPGLGPAHVLAEQGFATISSAMPLNPERLPGGLPKAFLNFANLAAYSDTFRQGVIEQRLLLEALDRLKVKPALLSTTAGAMLPAGKKAFEFQTSSVVALGQSHGAQYVNMLSAIEPEIKAVVPTGSPAFWPLLLSKTPVSPLIGLLLGTSQKLDLLYPGLHLLETAWEAADPLVYMPRIAKYPLAGQPVRSIYQPVGKGDTEVPEAVYDALALASGVKQAGSVVWSEMQASLALAGLDGIAAYPVANNVLSENGTPYTGVVVQYEGDGIVDAHTIFSQLNAVKFQYANFFKSLIETGTAVVQQP